MIRRPQPPDWIAVLPILWALLGVIALLAVGAMLAPVRAQSSSIPVACTETQRVKASLSAVGERVMARGITANNAMVELWLNPSTRTFSVVVRLSNEASCLVISGDGFERGGEDDPS